MPQNNIKDVVVVGGGVASKGFLSVANKMYDDLSITVISDVKESLIPCGIPYAIGTLSSPELNVDPRKRFTKAGVKFQDSAATGIDRKEHKINLKNGNTVSYDKLILAAGADSILPKVPGYDLDGVHIVKKNLENLKFLKNKVMEANNVVVIGGGFIGVEMADEITKLDTNVSLVEAADYCLWQAFDPEFGDMAEQQLKNDGVNIYTSRMVKELSGENGHVKEAVLDNGNSLPADLVIFAVGVKPRDELAKESGLAVADKGGIVVDSYMYTEDPDILAVGDCTAKVDLFDGRPNGIRLASVAATEGKLAALNLTQKDTARKSSGVFSLFATAMGDIYLGAAGMTEKQAEEKNLGYIVTEAQLADRHPSYMPGKVDTKCKAIFSRPEGKLLGVQVKGGSNTADLTNLFGLAIQKELTAYDMVGFQYGTHPMQTPGPTIYPAFPVAELAIQKLQK